MGWVADTVGAVQRVSVVRVDEGCGVGMVGVYGSVPGSSSCCCVWAGWVRRHS